MENSCFHLLNMHCSAHAGMENERCSYKISYLARNLENTFAWQQQQDMDMPPICSRVKLNNACDRRGSERAKAPWADLLRAAKHELVQSSCCWQSKICRGNEHKAMSSVILDSLSSSYIHKHARIHNMWHWQITLCMILFAMFASNVCHSQFRTPPLLAWFSPNNLLYYIYQLSRLACLTHYFSDACKEKANGS